MDAGNLYLWSHARSKMQRNLNMIIAPADFPSVVRGDDIPATPDMRAKVSKSSTEQRSPEQRSPDASDVPESSVDGMKDATGSQQHGKIQPTLPLCVKATTCDAPENSAIGEVDNGWQQTPDEEVNFERRLHQATETADENILNSERPMTIHEVNAQWTRTTRMTRMTRMTRVCSPTFGRRISWSKKLHVTHLYCEKRQVDTESDHERLKIKLNKSQMEVEELREQVIEGLKKIVGLKRKIEQMERNI